MFQYKKLSIKLICFIVLISLFFSAHANEQFPRSIKLFNTEKQEGGKRLYLALNNKQLSREDEERNRPLINKKYDYEGLKEDTYFFFGYQFFIIGVLFVSPESVSGWSEEQKSNFTYEKYKNNVKSIQWDNDKFYINYIMHPYWGMTYYIRGRERGLTKLGSFWYSTLLSSMWEFGIEAMFEEVSIQDVFITPIMGAVIGKYVEKYYVETQNKKNRTGYDEFMLRLIDPLGYSNRWVKRMFGKESSISFSYSLIDKYETTTLGLTDEPYYDGRKLSKNNISLKYGLTYKYQF